MAVKYTKDGALVWSALTEAEQIIIAPEAHGYEGVINMMNPKNPEFAATVAKVEKLLGGMPAERAPAAPAVAQAEPAKVDLEATIKDLEARLHKAEGELAQAKAKYGNDRHTTLDAIYQLEAKRKELRAQRSRVAKEAYIRDQEWRKYEAQGVMSREEFLEFWPSIKIEVLKREADNDGEKAKETMQRQARESWNKL